MIIFESSLTTFEASFIFWGSWGSIKNWLELKIEPPLADLALLNPWNTLYPLYNKTDWGCKRYGLIKRSIFLSFWVETVLLSLFLKNWAVLCCSVLLRAEKVNVAFSSCGYGTCVGPNRIVPSLTICNQTGPT